MHLQEKPNQPIQYDVPLADQQDSHNILHFLNEKKEAHEKKNGQEIVKYTTSLLSSNIQGGK